MGSLQGLINRAKSEVGYIEKASNSQLDSKLANIGTNNYTKYSRDINNWGLRGYNGSPWCSSFSFWLEVMEFGLDTALSHFHMTRSNYCAYNVFATRDEFPANKRSKTPQLGSLVVFTQSHMGRVIAINGNTITTVEGNTSPKLYDRNGGMVAIKTYDYRDSKIQWFLIIDYDRSNEVPYNNSTSTVTGTTHTVVKGDTLSAIAKAWGVSTSDLASYNNITNPNNINIGQVIKKPGTAINAPVPSTPSISSSGSSLVRDGQIHANNFANCGIETDGQRGSNTKRAGIKCLQTAMNLDYRSGLSVDGVWGTKSDAALRGHTLRLGETQYMITAVQILLMLKGYNPSGLECPGSFGSGCEAAVREYQSRNGLTVDGIVGYNTIKSLMA